MQIYQNVFEPMVDNVIGSTLEICAKLSTLHVELAGYDLMDAARETKFVHFYDELDGVYANLLALRDGLGQTWLSESRR